MNSEEKIEKDEEYRGISHINSDKMFPDFKTHFVESIRNSRYKYAAEFKSFASTNFSVICLERIENITK